MNNNVTVEQSFNPIISFLDQYKTQLSANKNPVVKQGLQTMLGELYEVNRALDPSIAPPVVDLSGASTADIVSTLIFQMRKTNDLVGKTNLSQLKRQHDEIKAQNAEQLKNLEKSSENAKKAANISKGLGIFRWAMLALSILLLIASTVATVTTFGASTAATVASAVVLATSATMLIVSTVPVDGKHSAMDLASQKLNDVIKDASTKAIIAKYGDKWEKMSDSAQAKALEKAAQDGTYGSLGIMIGIQVIIAIVMIALTVGASSGTAASNIGRTVANSADDVATATANAAVTSSRVAGDAGNTVALTTAESLRGTLQRSTPQIYQLSKMFSTSVTLIKDGGTIAASGMQMKAADMRQDAAIDKAKNKEIEAFVNFLQDNNQLIISLVNELNQLSAQSTSTAVKIVRDQHRNFMTMSANIGGASSV